MGTYYKLQAVKDHNFKYYIMIPNNRDCTYPVVYALHGSGGPIEWINYSQGNIEKRMENLAEFYKKAPFILVMPMICSNKKNNMRNIGNIVIPKIHSDIKESEKVDDNTKKVSNARELFLDYKFADFTEMIEHKYCDIIKSGAENTAITGFSMGGTAAIYHAIHNKDKFNYIGAISVTNNAKSWIPKGEFNISNNNGKLRVFIGYGGSEVKDFIAQDEYCIERFEHSKCDITQMINSNTGHGFDTFNPLQDHFFRNVVFK
jgi:dienelactone hydrolase